MCQLLGLPTAFLRGQLPDGLDADVAVEAASARHLGCYRGESAPAMVRRYQDQVLGAAVTDDTYEHAPYLEVEPCRRRRAELARVRLGCSSMVPEDTGRIRGLDRASRPCPCGAALGSAAHVLLECPRTAGLREEHASISWTGMTLPAFLGQEDQTAVARYVSCCAEALRP